MVSVILLIGFIIFVLDRVIKEVVIKSMSLGQSIPLIKNVFHLTFVQNIGAGFSLFSGWRWFIVLVSVGVLFAIYYYWDKIPKLNYVRVSIGLVIGGTLGNLYDRIVFGHVIDYLDFRFWPVFNLADTALVIAAILLGIYFWREESLNIRNHK